MKKVGILIVVACMVLLSGIVGLKPPVNGVNDREQRAIALEDDGFIEWWVHSTDLLL